MVEGEGAVLGVGLVAVLALPAVAGEDIVPQLPAVQGAALVLSSLDVWVLHQLGVEAEVLDPDLVDWV